MPIKNENGNVSQFEYQTNQIDVSKPHDEQFKINDKNVSDYNNENPCEKYNERC